MKSWFWMLIGTAILTGGCCSVDAMLGGGPETTSVKRVAQPVVESTKPAKVEKDLSTVEGAKVKDGKVVFTLGGEVNFERKSSKLTADAKAKIAVIAKSLKAQTAYKVTVTGYTDARGKLEMNQKLSEDRAEAVKAVLVEGGVAAKRITAVGKGPADPVASNDTAENRAKNRRVEISCNK